MEDGVYSEVKTTLRHLDSSSILKLISGFSDLAPVQSPFNIDCVKPDTVKGSLRHRVYHRTGLPSQAIGPSII